MKTMKKLYYIIFTALIVTSCELYDQDDYVEQYVVESYQVALHPLADIQLTRTAPINEVFDLSQRGVSGASVVVREFDQNSNLVQLFTYSYSGNGRYSADSPDNLVKPRYRYDLEITLPDKLIRASTVVPDTFVLSSINAISLPYQSPQQFELKLTPSFYPGRQGYYVFSNETLDPLNAEMTPFYADASGDREDFYRISSGIVNETSTGQNGNALVELKFPWIGIAFYGPNRLRAAAIDDNMYDFIRSISTQGGGSNISPGEIQNFISNVEGGIGVFGSYADVYVDVTVTKP